MKNWVLGSMTAAMSVGGLFVASNAGHGVAYYGGLLFFMFAVLFVMMLVKVSYDEVSEVTALGEFRELFIKMATVVKPSTTSASAPARPGQIVVHTIGVADLREALVKGFADFKETPTHVIFLVVIYPVVTFVFARMTAGYEILPLVFPLFAGYTLVGPLVAIGMYELSRRRETGLDSSRRHAFGVIVSPHIRAIAGLGLILLMLYLAWLASAMFIYQQTFGGIVLVSIAELSTLVFATTAGWTLIVVGSGVGFVFATVVFTLSVVSFPMLLDRNVSIMTAVQTSVRAVLANPLTMAIWGFIIAGALLLGTLPFFVGLAFVLPVLGHSTWHLYRKVVEH